MNTTDINESYKLKIIDDCILFDKYIQDYIKLINSSIEDNFILGFTKPLDNDIYNLYIDNIKQELKSKSLELIFVFKNISLVATVSLRYFKNTSKAHICEIHKGIIKKEERSLAVLKELFRAIVSQTEHHGISKIVLDVRENSKAHKMWKYIGFSEYGKLLDYSRIGDESYAGCFMEIGLNKLKKFTGR